VVLGVVVEVVELVVVLGVVVVAVVVVELDVDADVAEVVVAGTVVVVPGGGGDTRFVARDVAMLVPFLLLAVPTTRIVKPTSAEVSRSVCATAPFTGAQVSPLLEQRNHWKLSVGDGPLQAPVLAFSVSPTIGCPLIEGTSLFNGALWPGADDDCSLPALALDVNTSSANMSKAMGRRRIPSLSAVASCPLTRLGGFHPFLRLIHPEPGRRGAGAPRGAGQPARSNSPVRAKTAVGQHMVVT
jgi:hypothetical protein